MKSERYEQKEALNQTQKVTIDAYLEYPFAVLREDLTAQEALRAFQAIISDKVLSSNLDELIHDLNIISPQEANFIEIENILDRLAIVKSNLSNYLEENKQKKLEETLHLIEAELSAIQKENKQKKLEEKQPQVEDQLSAIQNKQKKLAGTLDHVKAELSAIRKGNKQKRLEEALLQVKVKLFANQKEQMKLEEALPQVQADLSANQNEQKKLAGTLRQVKAELSAIQKEQMMLDGARLQVQDELFAIQKEQEKLEIALLKLQDELFVIQKESKPMTLEEALLQAQTELSAIQKEQMMLDEALLQIQTGLSANQNDHKQKKLEEARLQVKLELSAIQKEQMMLDEALLQVKIKYYSWINHLVEMRFIPFPLASISIDDPADVQSRLEALNEARKKENEKLRLQIVDQIKTEFPKWIISNRSLKQNAKKTAALQLHEKEIFFSDEEIALYVKKDAWSTIRELYKLYHHRFLHHRAAGSYQAACKTKEQAMPESSSLSYGIINRKAKFITYSDGVSTVESEEVGLLGLTAQNDNSAPLITRESACAYIKHRIQQEINSLQARLSSIQENEEQIFSLTHPNPLSTITEKEWYILIERDKHNEVGFYLEGVICKKHVEGHIENSGTYLTEVSEHKHFIDHYKATVSPDKKTLSIQTQTLYPTSFEKEKMDKIIGIIPIDNVQGKNLKSKMKPSAKDKKVIAIADICDGGCFNGNKNQNPTARWFVKKLTEAHIPVSDNLLEILGLKKKTFSQKFWGFFSSPQKAVVPVSPQRLSLLSPTQSPAKPSETPSTRERSLLSEASFFTDSQNESFESKKDGHQSRRFASAPGILDLSLLNEPSTAATETDSPESKEEIFTTPLTAIRDHSPTEPLTGSRASL